MSIASFKNVSIHYGTDTILDKVEFNIAKGERVCLTGRNGSGKSTLMRLLCGQIHVDEGTIWREKALSFSNLEQDLPAGDDTTIFAAVASAFQEAGQAKSTNYTCTPIVKHVFPRGKEKKKNQN